MRPLKVKWFVSICDTILVSKKNSGTGYKELKFCENKGIRASIIDVISDIMTQYHVFFSHMGSIIKHPGLKLGLPANWLCDLV